MDLSEIQSLIKEGSQKKAEETMVDLRGEIEEKQRVLDDGRARQRSLEAELLGRGDEKLRLKVTLTSLEQVKSFISEEKYRPARADLVKSIIEAERRDAAVAAELDDMKAENARRVQEIDKLRDKLSALTSPNHRPKYRENECIGAFLDECRPEIKTIYDEVSLLPNRIKDESSYHKMQVMAKLAAGNVRKNEESLAPLNSAEDYVFKKCYDLVGRMAREFSLGYIDPLNKKYDQNWGTYTRERKRELLFRESSRKSKTTRKTTREEPNKEDAILVEAIVSSGLMDKTKDMRIAIYGGKTRVEVIDWLEGALKLKRATWYEYESHQNVKSLASSIKANGVDLLVCMTQWMAHKFNTVIDEAKAAGRPVALCNSSSKKEICMQVAYALGLRLDQHLRRAEECQSRKTD